MLDVFFFTLPVMDLRSGLLLMGLEPGLKYFSCAMCLACTSQAKILYKIMLPSEHKK